MLTAAVCIALSGAGLAVSFLTAWRRRFLRATRLAAWSLLPVGLYMTGLVPLVRKIGKAAGTWGADLVFKPTVWAGILVLAVSALLFLITRFAGKRSGSGAGRRVRSDSGVPEMAPTASAPALPEPARRTPPARKGGSSGDDGLSDFKDIEEILRRRGI
jgi:hypothetical protein